jgi:Protein of unknown function (DUF2490)
MYKALTAEFFAELIVQIAQETVHKLSGAVRRFEKGILNMRISRGSLLPVRRLLRAIPILFSIVWCSLMPLASSPAQADVQEDFRIWENATARGNFGFINTNNPDLKRWRWWAEAQIRSRESGKELDQLLLRPGIGYALTDHSTVFVGYAHVSNHTVNTGLVQENRIWQQYQWSGPTFLGAFTSRSRLEERWQENGNDTGVRFRELLKFNWPFSFHPAASFVLSDEMFVNLVSTDWGPPTSKRGFDQNRGFAGIGYRFTPIILMEVGYLNQYVNTTPMDRMNHALSINVYLDF